MSCKRIGEFYGMDGELYERQYRGHLSGYRLWDQLPHATDWILYEKNIGSYVGIDEVALSRGELYTILINKEAKGKKGSIIAIIKGTDVKTVCNVLLKMSRRRRFQVREITLDMAPNMELIAKTCFPAAKRVIDRFHVQKLAFEAVQEMRIKARWQALDREAVDTLKANDTLPQPLKTGIPSNNCLPVAVIFYSRKNHYGHKHRNKERISSSGNIPTSRKHII